LRNLRRQSKNLTTKDTKVHEGKLPEGLGSEKSNPTLAAQEWALNLTESYTSGQVPKGRLPVARHESAGNSTETRTSPDGTADWLQCLSHGLQKLALSRCLCDERPAQRYAGRLAATRLGLYGRYRTQNGFKGLAAGGIEDHVHLLISLPATMPVAKAVQLIKAGSSKWIREEFGRKLFAWQEAYGAFTIGISQREATRRYIARQKTHHKGRDFKMEWEVILARHGLKEFET